MSGTDRIDRLILPLPRSANINGSRGGRYVVPTPHDPLDRRRYRTTIEFYDKFSGADGEPNSKNIDNLLKILLDALAGAYGLGTRGRGDKWLDWELHLFKVEWDGEPFCSVSVSPL